MKLWWYDTVKYERCRDQNGGDIFNKWLFEKLGYSVEFSENPEILATGSILRCSAWQGSPYIWGSGFHNDYDSIRPNIDMNNVKAVRGVLTRNKLGLNDNVVIGDPGLLASYFYKPKTVKKYKYGFIPHYTDMRDFKSKYGDNVCIIDILTSNVEDLLDKINECEFIFSSSLHGIVFSHSLGIPAIHVENKPLYSLDNFKFKDYYSVYKDITYTKELLNSIDVQKYLNSDYNLYKPSNEELIKIQNNLLNCFPFELNR